MLQPTSPPMIDEIVQVDDDGWLPSPLTHADLDEFRGTTRAFSMFRRTLGPAQSCGEFVLPTDLSSRTYLYQESGDEQTRAS